MEAVKNRDYEPARTMRNAHDSGIKSPRKPATGSPAILSIRIDPLPFFSYGSRFFAGGKSREYTGFLRNSSAL